MTDLIDKICALRRDQKDSPHLLPPSQIESWINKAETKLKRLQSLKPQPDSQEYIEADCLSCNLDELQQRRAELIWALAYDGAGDVTLMTEREADIYRDLQGYAGELRGES